MKKGDHICVKHPVAGDLIVHHGIYCGDGTVIHFDGKGKLTGKAKIRRDSLEHFSTPLPISEILVLKQCPSDFADEVVQKAESFLGQSGYDLFGRNCEHFAFYCISGQWESKQVDDMNKAIVEPRRAAGNALIKPNVLRLAKQAASGQRDPVGIVAVFGATVAIAGVMAAGSYVVKKVSEMDSLRKSQPPKK